MIVVERDGRIAAPLAATIGMFDGVHVGHRSLISFLVDAAGSRRLSPAVVTFREHPQLVLRPSCGLRLLMTFPDKMKALGSLGLDYAIVLPFDASLARLTAREFIRVLRERYNVRLLVVGYDHRFGHDPADTFADYAAYGTEAGVEVVQAPPLTAADGRGVSSSLIRRLLLDGDAAEASRLLTRPYSLSGTVVGGLHNGRRIGFPTANLRIDDERLLVPANGVYAVEAVIADGTKYGGMLNIGNRPTVGIGLERTVEANLFGFEGDLYGQMLTLRLLDRVRDERRMDGFDGLRRQLELDRKACMEIINQKISYENR